MTSLALDIALNSPAETAALAARIAPQLRPGDSVLLNGPVGAGKTHFARHLIQSVLQIPEDVPSPTYTLVQTYDTRLGEIWHADLYRLTAIEEVEELGLSEALEDAICLIEWPDRLGELSPDNATSLLLEPDSGDFDKRTASFSWSDPKWSFLAELAL
ncbi:MAG: tRNA (adenosine(37)-N6)-threonylcarbamoyltransferase complex ATPase subunit type 1 TsaE [Pseudomonadota bacterium]